MGGGGRYLGTAIVVILAITAWVLGHMIPFFIGMKAMGLLRVDESEERMGLDVSHHGGAAYEATAGEVLGKGAKEDDALLTRCVFSAQAQAIAMQCVGAAARSVCLVGVHNGVGTARS